MAKLRETIGNAVLDVEGDAEAIHDASRLFHAALAEQALRDVEDKLAALRPLQKQQRDLKRIIGELKTRTTPAIKSETVQ